MFEKKEMKNELEVIERELLDESIWNDHKKGIDKSKAHHHYHSQYHGNSHTL